jgi:hypothetical protein
MKKLLLTILCMALLAPLAFGWSEGNSSDWKTYAVTNTSGADYLLTAVSTDIIPKGSAILGYEIMGIPGINGEYVCTVYDGGVSSLDEVLGEAETVVNVPGGKWFGKSKTLQKQIYIHQGPKTVVTIYFE